MDALVEIGDVEEAITEIRATIDAVTQDNRADAVPAIMAALVHLREAAPALASLLATHLDRRLVEVEAWAKRGQ